MAGVAGDFVSGYEVRRARAVGGRFVPKTCNAIGRRPAILNLPKVYRKRADEKQTSMLAESPQTQSNGLTADEIVRDLKHLPSAPKVLPRLKRLLADTNSSMAEIVSLIRLDPGIAARVLQVGNSTYYSQGVRVLHD